MKLFLGLMSLPVMALPILAQEAVGQKTYVLAREGGDLPVKEKFKVIKDLSMTDAKIKVEFDGRGREGIVSHSHKKELIYEFVSMDEIRVIFERNRELKKSSMKGPGKNQEKVDPSEGRTILLSKKEGKWVGKLEVGEMKEADQEEFNETLEKLEREFNGDSSLQLYGTKPRKVGESWDVDPTVMPGLDRFDVKGGKLTMTFMELKEFQGEPCAVLKTSFSIKAEMTEDKMKGLGVTFEGSGRVLRSLTHLVDYKFTGDMTMAVSGDVEVQPGVNAKLSMDGDMKIDMRMAKAKAKAEAK